MGEKLNIQINRCRMWGTIEVGQGSLLKTLLDMAYVKVQIQKLYGDDGFSEYG